MQNCGLESVVETAFGNLGTAGTSSPRPQGKVRSKNGSLEYLTVGEQ